jgi:hypothetical protein
MVTFNSGATPEEMGKAIASIAKINQQIEDFCELAATIESDNPARDAWKAVYGWDNPALDENTKEGQASRARIARMFGRRSDEQEPEEL